MVSKFWVSRGLEMSLKTVRRLVARIAGCGESRVKIVDAAKAAPALTADDVRDLLEQKAVVIVAKRGVGRGKARGRAELRRKGRKRRAGSIKGTPNALLPRKRRWIRLVRSQRRALKHLRLSLAQGSYKKLYRMVKGRAFPDKRRLLEYVKNKGLTKQGVKRSE